MEFIEKRFHSLGETFLFMRDVLWTAAKSFNRREEIFQQTLEVIWQSLLTTAFAGFFVGAIMTLQFTLQVQMFSALSFLGGLVTSATVREVGPLLIAFLLSGKIGAFTSAELGTMKVSEQIDAIRCLGADPIKEVIVPRFMGIIIASFFLLTVGLICSFFGGVLMATTFSGIPWEQYNSHIPTVMTEFSIISGGVKCFAFSLVIATLCTFRGYTVLGGAKEVGEGVVQAATQTMITLVLADWISSFFLERLLNV
ncbi:MAG: ABC transporter permease [Bdellovibrionales bacterium]|nr:ABC transporter permease [Bdellovibrionales bacterium]NQZ18839.1 ABC transporter permease [Bdellovibrionales bacterium]